MKVNAGLIIKLRKRRSWSQDELAIAAGLNLRTIQRIESEASASLQSRKALAAALEIKVEELEADGVPMITCPVCSSTEIYGYQKDFRDTGGTGDTLLPGLGANMLFVAKVRTTVCQECGHVQIFASEEARSRLKTSKHWKAVNT